MSLLCFTSYS